MGKIIADIALVAGGIAMGVFSFGLADLGYLGGIMGAMTSAQVSSLAMTMGMMGGGMLMSSIGQALAGGGPAASTSMANPAASRKTIYGQTRTAGTKIYVSTIGGGGYDYNQVIAWASHPCQSVDFIYVDGREVYFTGCNHSAVPGAQGYTDEHDHWDPAKNKYNFYASSGNYHLLCLSSLGTLSIPAPTTHTVATTGGSLAPGTYFYRITALDGNGGETLACPEFSIVVPAGTSTNKITLNWTSQFATPGVVGFDNPAGYNIYGRTAGAEQWIGATFTTYPGGGSNPTYVTTFTDTGGGTPTGAMPVKNTAGNWLWQFGLGIRPPGGDYAFSGDPAWNSSCTLNHICASYVAATSSADMFANFPQIKALVKGKNDIYDPRLGPLNSDGSVNPACCAWTQNSALIIADHLTNLDYGMRVPWSKIDLTQLVAAANICDTQITLATNLPTWQPNTVYTLNQIVVDPHGYQQQVTSYYGNPPTSSTTLPTIAMNARGTGYEVGDVITCTQSGFFSTGGTLTATVTSVDGAGAVTSISLTSYTGSFYATTSATTGGHGTGATLTVALVTNNISGATSGGGTPTGGWVDSTGGTTHDGYLVWTCTGETGNVVTESQFQINGEFEWAALPGDTLTQLLESCAGRIAYWNGQYKVMPGAWYGASGVSYSMSDLVAPPTFKKSKSRDLFNAVRAKYICPDFPYSVVGFDKAHKFTGTFDGQYQPTDCPEYMQDYLHGYGTISSPYQGDEWLAADGGIRLYQDKSYQFVQSVGQCQRLMKIALLRDRFCWTGTIRVNAKALQNAPGDVITLTIPMLGFDNHLFEILEMRHVMNIEDGKPPQLAWELDLKETDPSIYTWSTAEERTMTDANSPTLQNAYTQVAPVTNVTLSATLADALVGADGVVTPRINVQWTEPADPFVTSGGSITVQYQLNGDSTWTQAAICSGITTQLYIAGVVAGGTYNVQLQAAHASGATSVWVEA